MYGSWLPQGFEFLSGLPERLRRKRLFLTLQTWCDDSGGKGTGRWMVLAALFGESGAFAALADDWDRWLQFKHPGAIAYFKMDEALTLDGEFRHWREDHRDEKVRQLGRLLDRPELTEVVAIVDLHAFEKVASEIKINGRPVQGRHPLSQPYMLAFGQILVGAASEALALGSGSPMEVVFDQHDLFQPIYQRIYPDMRAHMKNAEMRALLPVQPWFRDDRDFVVLQAADMLAGQVRITAEKKAPSWVLSLYPQLRVSQFSKLFDEPTLRDLANGLRQSAIEQGFRFDD